jgi:hypothetical protein
MIKGQIEMSSIEEILKLIKAIKAIEERLKKAGLDINNLEDTVAKLEAMSDEEQRKIIGRNYDKFKKLTQWQPGQS